MPVAENIVALSDEVAALQATVLAGRLPCSSATGIALEEARKGSESRT